MSKTVLNDLVNLENQTSSVNTINANNAVIETAFDNTLSRNGISPNQMESFLDMNSNRIINLPEAVSTTEPITLTQINTIIASGQIPNGLVSVGIPVSAAMQPVVNASTITSARALLFISGTPIEFYGGKGDNSTDNSPALAAFYAANPTGGSLSFGSGTYKFNSVVSVTFPNAIASYSFIGKGSDSTIFSFPSSNGFSFTYTNTFNCVHFSGLTFQTLSANLYTAVALTQTATIGVLGPVASNNIFYDVNFRGETYSGVNLWANAIHSISVSNINFISCLFNGTYPSGNGVILDGSVSSFGVVYNFECCNFYGLSQGIQYGGTTGYVQGVTVNNCNFTGVDFGIVTNPSLSGLGGLNVTNSQFTPRLGAGIYQTSEIPGTAICNNYFLAGVNGCNLINFINNNQFQITGNSFAASGLTTCSGIVFLASRAGTSGIITGNNFQDMAVGINLQVGSANINVQSNSYINVSTHVSNGGSGNTIGGGSA